MKKLLLSVSLSLLFLFNFNLGDEVFAYDKKSLVERFTNTSCGPCASINNAWYNATTGGMVSSGAISHIIYNVWWPGASDPMYLLNQADNTTRTNYYGCNAVPWIEVNATHISNSQGALNSAVTNGNAEYAPFNIEITQGALGPGLIEVGVKIIRDPNDVTTFGNVKLRVAITETTVSFPSPPGNNGESEFFSVCRKMMPDAGGSTFTIPAPGDSVELNLQYVPTSAFIQAVNFDSLRIVAFIQDDNGQEVYQSTMKYLAPDYAAQMQATSPVEIMGENNTPAEFVAVIQNSGILDDTYYIDCDFNAPAGWSGEFTTNNGTFPFGQTDSVQVVSGNSTEITVSVNPNGLNGFGETTLEFLSANNPGVTGSLLFKNITTNGIDILVIDASEGGYGSVITNSLENVYSGTYGIVSREVLQDPGADLSNFLIMAWSSGIALPAFYPEEVTHLQSFLDGGGRLFINGQNIGQDIFETNGQSQFAQGFYNNYLHSEYVDDQSYPYIITGYAGDPIANGIQFQLGAVYAKSVDWISPFSSDAVAIFEVENGPEITAIRAEKVDYRLVYLAFGLEQIDETEIRDTLMARSISWLMEGIILPSVEDELSCLYRIILDRIIQTLSIHQQL